MMANYTANFVCRVASPFHTHTHKVSESAGDVASNEVTHLLFHFYMHIQPHSSMFSSMPRVTVTGLARTTAGA